MTERSTSPPGTRLVAALIALGLLAAAWMRLGRVIVPVDGAVASSAAAPWPDMRLDLNTASVPELVVLPGLGPALAQRIVEDRMRRGRFGAVEELRRVEGIGAAVVERAAPHLVVLPASR